MRSRRVLTAATIGLIGFGLSGCDEPAYDGPREQPAYLTEQQTQPAPQRRATGGGSGSAYGAATRAAHGVAGKAAQQQQRIQQEIDD